MDAVGSTTKPIFINEKGAAVPMGKNVGNVSTPVYMENGELKACTLSAEAWTFEALDGTTMNKNVVTN